MTTLISTQPTRILRPGYGVVFEFGESHVGALVGCVYLLRKPNVLDREESYYVVFNCVWAWDERQGYHYLGYVPLSKRDLSEAEIAHFEAMVLEITHVEAW